jgi:resuscitation-promoting factor RpfB
VSAGGKVAAAAVVALLAAGAGHAGAYAGGPSSSGANERMGMAMAAGRGWIGQQASCLNWLWTRESGWSAVARNPNSGAYGIAQALGHGPSNQYPAGPANPPQSSARAQVRWGLRYLRTVYGTPCRAWAQETSQGWY